MSTPCAEEKEAFGGEMALEILPEIWVTPGKLRLNVELNPEMTGV